MGAQKLGFVLVCVLFLKLGATENRAEAVCPEDSVPCDDGNQCIKRDEWCDKNDDCPDKSDEKYCQKKRYFWRPNPNDCEEDTHFLCDDGQCVPLVAKCDGHEDCSDGSDEKCESEGNYDDYEASSVVTTTEHASPEAFSDVLDEDDFPSSSSIPTLSPIPVGRSDAPTSPSIIPENGWENELDSTDASISVSTPDTPLHSPATTLDYYANRLKEENDQLAFKLPSSTISSHVPPAITDVPRAHETQNAQTTSTTSRPLSSTITISYPESHYPRQSHDRTQAPVSQPYSHQWRAHATHPTRSYVNSYQYTTTRPTRAYDSRRDPYPYQTPPSRSYDTRRDPYQYNPQPTTSHDARRDPYHYQTQSARHHDLRHHPYEYQTPSSVPTRYTYNPHQAPGKFTILTTTPGTRYPAVTHRVYFDHGYYYGYYNDVGQFVVLRTNGDGHQPTRVPHNVDNRNWQPARNPYHVNERHTHRPMRTTPMPIAFTRQLKVPSRFYFSKNLARIYGDKNRQNLRKGKEFILSQRKSTGDWGIETPRALVALSLIDNSFVNNTYENNMMQRSLQVFLGSSLLRGDAKTTTLSRLAMAINALLATCQNPRDFHGTDLTVLIQNQLNQIQRERTRTAPVSPSVYLSLCLANKELTHHDLHNLMTHLNAHSTPDEYSKDMLSLSISAFSCHLHQQQFRDSDYYRSLESLLINATSKLLDKMLDDGSFGSVYSTAIAAQALISVNDSKQWNAESTINYLKQEQLEDGSFGDFLATYWTLPVLSGRSLLHLRNTQCTPPKVDRILTPSEIMEFTGPKQHIRYSLYIGYPNVNGNSLEVLVPQGISFFDIMRVAEHQNSAFKFSYEEKNEQIQVYSISNVPNDAERGFQWNLYVKRSTDTEQVKLNVRERVTGDIRGFYPRSDQHVIFWYHPSVVTS